mgnify:CR=1 FL=1
MSLPLGPYYLKDGTLAIDSLGIALVDIPAGTPLFFRFLPPSPYQAVLEAERARDEEDEECQACAYAAALYAGLPSFDSGGPIREPDGGHSSSCPRNNKEQP